MEFFSTIFYPIESLLRFVLESLFAITSAAGFASYGWAIILLTIIVKMALYPLTVKQVKSMKAMQELSPKMKKIQEKYKDNPQMMQQKIGALYKDAGVNPLVLGFELDKAAFCRRRNNALFDRRHKIID